MLAGIVKRFPDLQVSALLRSESQEFTGFFPKVEVILGDLASFEVIEKATQNADITIRTCFLLDNRSVVDLVFSRCGEEQPPRLCQRHPLRTFKKDNTKLPNPSHWHRDNLRSSSKYMGKTFQSSCMVGYR